MQTIDQTQKRCNLTGSQPASPFDLTGDESYRSWRDAKLAAYPASVSELVVEIGDLAKPDEAERAALIDRCHKANMAIYTTRPAEAGEGRVRNGLRAFAQAIGLHRTEGHRSAADDGIVAIEIARDRGRKGYIPYSDRPLNWHTDGYYNAPKDRVGAFLLHCVRSAKDGGENGLLDPEIAYIRLRDENPDFIAAFMHHEAMTIPANVEDNGKVRAESTGPVFCVNPRTGRLQMRYTARGRNIVWRNTPDTLAAARFLAGILAGGDPLILRHKLSPGQGLICNNVLHARTGFKSGPGLPEHSNRLIYRVRYLDSIGDQASRNNEEDHGPTE